jgi:hypothetical protein
MSLRKECDVRDPLPNKPGVEGSKRNLPMRCANPQCSKESLYFREGRLELFDLESHAGDQFPPDDGAFAIKSLPSKFFWLCGECAKTHIVKRWTSSGLVLVLRNQKTVESRDGLAARPAAETTRPPPPSPANPPAPPPGHPLT